MRGRAYAGPELIAALRRCAAERMTMRQAGDKLGMTRNAVAGLAYRNGVAFGSGVRAKKFKLRSLALHREPRTQAKLARTPAPKQTEAATAPELAFEAARVPELAFPTGVRCTLMELTNKNCHWPVAQFFCNAAAVPGLPYCEYHRRLGVQPSRTAAR